MYFSGLTSFFKTKNIEAAIRKKATGINLQSDLEKLLFWQKTYDREQGFQEASDEVLRTEKLLEMIKEFL